MTLLLQAEGKDGPQIMQLAVRLLGCWADASVVNCGKIAGMHGGAKLLHAAQIAAGRPALQEELIRTMALLGRWVHCMAGGGGLLCSSTTQQAGRWVMLQTSKAVCGLWGQCQHQSWQALRSLQAA